MSPTSTRCSRISATRRTTRRAICRKERSALSSTTRKASPPSPRSRSGRTAFRWRKCATSPATFGTVCIRWKACERSKYSASRKSASISRPPRRGCRNWGFPSRKSSTLSPSRTLSSRAARLSPTAAACCWSRRAMSRRLRKYAMSCSAYRKPTASFASTKCSTFAAPSSTRPNTPPSSITSRRSLSPCRPSKA